MPSTLDCLPDSLLAAAARLRAEMIRALPEGKRETLIALETIDRAVLWAEQALSDDGRPISMNVPSRMDLVETPRPGEE